MRTLKRGRLAALALAASLLLGTASASAVEATSSAPVVAEADVEIQLWMGANPSEAVAIVGVVVPDSVELPVTVRLPLLEGTQVDWAGEISGGDPSTDPPRKVKIVDGAQGGRYAEFTLEQFRVGQLDLSPTPHVEQGNNVSASFDYIEPMGVSSVIFSVRLPAIASDVKITPKPAGDPKTNEIGESLYTLAPVALKIGEKATIDVAYVADASKLDGGSTSDNFGTVIGVLAAVAVVALIAVVVLMGRGRRATTASEETEGD